MKIAFKLKLRSGSESEYERRHHPIKQELSKTFIENGVNSYHIFWDKTTNDLFAIVDVETIAQWETIRRSPAAKEWRVFMQPLLESDKNGDPCLTELVEVFSLENSAH
jgi:L-rhamnose mutarotase